MKYRIPAMALAAVLFAAGSAGAQTPEPSHPDKADLQRHFVEMCQDRLARATGEIAFLETKLGLTEQQMPLFERWKKIKLNAAKQADCTPPPDGEPSIVDRLKREEKMLRQRLDELKAEQPALEALVASLSAEQKNAFAPPHGFGPGAPHPGGPGLDHRRGPGADRPHGEGPGDDEHGAPPPPPEH